LPLVEAEEKAAKIIASFFDEAIPAYVAWSNAWKLDATAARRTKLPPLAQGWSVRVEMGIGKTHAAIVTTADHVRRHRQVVYVVPYHALAEEVAPKFKAQKIDAAIYRGAERKDPRNPAKDMCLNPKARKAAEALGISVRKAVCVDSAVDIVPVRCPFAGQCGVEWQRTLQPQLWIVPSSLLMIHRPDFIPEPDAVVIDERFHEASIDKPKVIDLDTLLTAPISDTCRHDERPALTEGRESLRAAIFANGPGPLSRAALLEHGISSERADWLSSLERRILDPSVLRPNMEVDDLVEIASKNADAYNVAHALIALWTEIEEFLYGESPEWARLKVAEGAEKITVRSLRTMHESWRAPTLILDATAPPADVLQRSLGGALSDVVEKADITAQWSEHLHIRQIFGAPVTMGKVGLFGEEKRDNVRDILRFIRWRAALSYPADIGLITYKGLLKKLQDKLPKNVTVTAHFGGLEGLNSMERVAGLIVLGRPYIKPVVAEANAEVFGGEPVPPVGKYYPKRPAAVCLANGTDYDANVDFHEDHLAEALRWQGTERGLLQAVGRMRPHRRREHCWLDLVTDVELPIPVHEKVGWDTALPGAVGDMADEGVILLNRRDVAEAFDDLSERQGRSDGRAEVGYELLFNNIKEFVPNLPCHRITYQRAGRGKKRNNGYYLPAVIGQPAALRAWLETRLHCKLATLEIEHPTGLAEWQPETMPIGELVRVFGGWLGES
jgi:hypothetical protein